jgi:hypothetical protein
VLQAEMEHLCIPKTVVLWQRVAYFHPQRLSFVVPQVSGSHHHKHSAKKKRWHECRRGTQSACAASGRDVVLKES